MFLRIVAGIVGLVVVFFGIKQITRGIREMSGRSAPQPQELGDTYTSAAYGYSHRIPKGWESGEPSPPTVAIVRAPKSSGLASNMVTTVETYDGTLRAYVDANIQAFKTAAPDAKVIGDAEFATDTKTPAYKLKLQNKYKDTALAQFMYLFGGASGKKIIVTCTAPSEHALELEPLFDQCMKTFAVSGG